MHTPKATLPLGAAPRLCHTFAKQFLWLMVCTLVGCGGAQRGPTAPRVVQIPLEPPIAEEPASFLNPIKDAETILLKNATLLTAVDEVPRIENGWI